MNATAGLSEEECTLPLYGRIIGIILIAFIMLIGTIGNTAVCLVIHIFKNSFETISHFFVTNVAISDLLTSLTVLPFDIIYWLKFPVFPLGSKVCRLWNAFYFAFLAASSLGICLIGADIYIAVTKPLHYEIIVTRERAYRAIISSWIWSLAIGALIYFFQEEPPEGAYLFQLNSIAYGIYLVVHIALPSFTIPVLYAKIFLIARKHEMRITPQISASKSEEKSCDQPRITIKRQLAMAKTFCFITLSFFVCWYPFFVVQMFYVLKLDKRVNWCRLETTDTIVCWLSYVQCCMNPIFYVFRRKKIRHLVLHRWMKRENEGNISEATQAGTMG